MFFFLPQAEAQRQQGLSEVTPKQLKCMTDNIYWEAQGEPLLGQVWVASVVLQRVQDPRWEDTVCGVVYQRKQFSWTNEQPKEVRYKREYKVAHDVALAALQGRIDTPTMNHYLRCDIMGKPHADWWKSMTFIGQLGDHCFFNAPL